jgi:hypothetical protein
MGGVRIEFERFLVLLDGSVEMASTPKNVTKSPMNNARARIQTESPFEFRVCLLVAPHQRQVVAEPLMCQR